MHRASVIRHRRKVAGGQTTSRSHCLFQSARICIIRDHDVGAVELRLQNKICPVRRSESNDGRIWFGRAGTCNLRGENQLAPHERIHVLEMLLKELMHE